MKYDDLNFYMGRNMGETLCNILRKNYQKKEREKLEGEDESGLCLQCIYELNTPKAEKGAVYTICKHCDMSDAYNYLERKMLNLRRVESDEESDNGWDIRLEELEELSSLRYRESDIHFKEIFERLSDMSEKVELLRSKIKEVDDSSMLRYQSINSYLKILMDRIDEIQG